MTIFFPNDCKGLSIKVYGLRIFSYYGVVQLLFFSYSRRNDLKLNHNLITQENIKCSFTLSFYPFLYLLTSTLIVRAIKFDNRNKIGTNLISVIP